MKKCFTILFYFLIVVSESQNLVPNSSFENYSSCSGDYHPVSDAIGWKGMQTPDYFNSCIVPTGSFNTDVPKNIVGYQMAADGNAYAGIGCFYAYNFREMIQTELVRKLNANSYYCASFKVSLADTSLWAINKLGAYFSSDTLNPEPYQSIPNPPFSIFTYYIPQIESTDFLNDTSSWVTISGTFQATGNEQYVTIGDFRDDNETDTMRIWNSGYRVSYYYIDDVSVEEVLNANAGNDTSIISMDSVQLGNNPTENATYLWQPANGLSDVNAANPMVWVGTNTTYIVTKTQCNVITKDTVVISSSMGINENEYSKKIKLYPNPNTGVFILELPEENASWKINIMDLQGRIIYEEISDKKKMELKMDLENGLYLIQITNSVSNETITKKIIVQK
jgi:hypothetical protein